MFKRSIGMGAVLVLAACTTVGPDYKRPEMDLPAAWGPVANGAVRAPEKWWSIFDDAALSGLVEGALTANRDLVAAAARIDASRAGVVISDADRYPIIGGGVTRSRTRSTQRGAVPLFPGVPVESNNTRATLSASYETDFWGKYTRASEAARAELAASQAGRDAILLALTTDVAKAYFSILALDAQEAVARRTLETRDQLVSLQKKRFEAGVASEFELRQVEAERDNAQVSLTAIVRERESDDARLGVLLGSSPREVWEKKAVAAGGVAVPAAVAIVVPEGLPSQLLERRPDIREAEQRLIAANARIGAARAAYFPVIALTGYLGSESASLANLFSGPARIWQFAAALTAPIWNAGRLDAQVDQVNARQREALANYEKAVQNSFADVRVAIAYHAAALETAQTQARRSAALAQSLKLARLRYDNGVSSLIDVLDAERNLLAAELSRVDALGAQKSAVADLVKALGGGWSEAPKGG
jgi:multidrug efflux system outer membrane protein